MSSSTVALFDTFNARALNPDQVAATFVPSDQFARLCNRAHTIVLGPRGSGKTTLLKMLQPAALGQWHHPDASAVREKVDFTGVFIATDISWGEQLAALGSGAIELDASRLLSLGKFYNARTAVASDRDTTAARQRSLRRSWLPPPQSLAIR